MLARMALPVIVDIIVTLLGGAAGERAALTAGRRSINLRRKRGQLGGRRRPRRRLGWARAGRPCYQGGPAVGGARGAGPFVTGHEARESDAEHAGVSGGGGPDRRGA